MQPGGIGPFYQLTDTPIQLYCKVTKAAPINTILSGAGVTAAVAGAIESFVVTLYDSGNNRLRQSPSLTDENWETVGGDTVLVTITPSQQNIEIFDNGDGSYLVKYRITQAGTFML